MKKTFPLILLSLLLAACGGKSEDAVANDAASDKAPKPTFKVKYIDEQAIAGLDLGTAQEGETKEGKKQRTYPINGIEGGVINLIGKHPTDLEVISGQCMEKMKKAFQPAGQPTASATLPLQNGGQYCPRRRQTDRLSDFTRCFTALYRRQKRLCRRPKRPLYFRN